MNDLVYAGDVTNVADMEDEELDQFLVDSNEYRDAAVDVEANARACVRGWDERIDEIEKRIAERDEEVA